MEQKAKWNKPTPASTNEVAETSLIETPPRTETNSRAPADEVVSATETGNVDQRRRRRRTRSERTVAAPIGDIRPPCGGRTCGRRCHGDANARFNHTMFWSGLMHIMMFIALGWYFYRTRWLEAAGSELVDSMNNYKMLYLRAKEKYCD